MPVVTIDNKQYEFEPGEKLLQLCLDHGVEISHFCYHPALSVPANCRQCLVRVGTPLINRETRQPETNEDGTPKIGFMPKLQPSCAVDVTDGMVVETHLTSDVVREGQEENMELLLINHPLDCPICDQAGHCPLQIQAYKFGPEGSRFEVQKNHKPKRVQLGPHVTLDAERCINCTRCTRFTSEVSESHQLSIIARGDQNYPMTAPGQPFDDPYSMCTTDICPVGALTETYFRFRARIWEMSDTPSILGTGSKGVNVNYWVKDNEVLRITPRQNLDVNEYWMADVDRLTYDRYNANRPAGPALRYDDGQHGPTGWVEAYRAAAHLLRQAGANVLFLGSAYATVEDNYLLGRLAEAVGAARPRFIRHLEPGRADNLTLTDDLAPNTAGCERLGMEAIDADGFGAALAGADVLYVLEDDPVAAGLCTAADLAGKKVILHHYHTTNQTLAHADVAFPAAMTVETVGTYVNEDGRAQLLRPAKATKTQNRTLMMAMGTGLSRLDRQGTPFDRWHKEANRVDCRPGWEIIPEIAQLIGKPMTYLGPKAVMNELSGQSAAFAGATHDAMGALGVALQDVGEPV